MDIEVRNQADVKIIKLRGRLNLGDSVDRTRQTFDVLMAGRGNPICCGSGRSAHGRLQRHRAPGPLPDRRQVERRVTEASRPFEVRGPDFKNDRIAQFV